MDTFYTFRQIKEDAKETTMLGRGFGLNQGMRTDIAGKLSFLDALEKVIKDAEEDYDTSDVLYFEQYINMLLRPGEKLENFDTIHEEFQKAYNGLPVHSLFEFASSNIRIILRFS